MVESPRRLIRDLSVIILLIVVVWVFVSKDAAIAGPYLDSAHGDTLDGVDRVGLNTPTDFGYPIGHCAHCHEQHASIGGAEPAPTGGSPSKYLLFRPVFASQTTGFCFRCHRASSDQQGGMPDQYNYSRMAGGDTTITCPTDIDEAFQFVNTSGVSQSNCGSTVGSSHFLDDIKIFLRDNAAASGWGWGATVNPCSGCHNLHSAQRDPHTTTGRVDGSGNLVVSVVSRPSAHSDLTTWELWGDDAGERMSDYSANYQAPYRKGSTTQYEPDGSTYQDGRNLVDYVSLCTDCHNSTNTIYSTVLGRNLKTIDWNNEKHGKANADGYITVDSPYTAGGGSLGYVLSCLDCHEPHGSPNAFLIREEVNGVALGGSISTFSTTDWLYLCDRCHQDDYELTTSCEEDHYYNIHHDTTYGGDPYESPPGMCGSCHGGSGMGGCTTTRTKLVCTDCHFHGSSHSGRVTF